MCSCGWLRCGEPRQASPALGLRSSATSGRIPTTSCPGALLPCPSRQPLQAVHSGPAAHPLARCRECRQQAGGRRPSLATILPRRHTRAWSAARPSGGDGYCPPKPLRAPKNGDPPRRRGVGSPDAGRRFWAATKLPAPQESCRNSLPSLPHQHKLYMRRAVRSRQSYGRRCWGVPFTTYCAHSWDREHQFPSYHSQERRCQRPEDHLTQAPPG